MQSVGWAGGGSATITQVTTQRRHSIRSGWSLHRRNHCHHNHPALRHLSNHRCFPQQLHHHHHSHRHHHLRRAPLLQLQRAVCSVPSQGRARPDSMAARTRPSTRARLNARPSAQEQHTVRQAQTVRVRAHQDVTATPRAQTRRMPASNAHVGPNAHLDQRSTPCALRAHIRELQARARVSSAPSTSSAPKAVFSLLTPFVLLARTSAD